MTLLSAPLTTASRLLAATLVPALTSFALIASGAGPASAAPVASTTQSTASTTTASKSAATAAPELSRAVYERRVLRAINVRRANHKLSKLGAGACADGYAEGWGKYLAEKDEFYHQDMGKVIKGCDAYYAGETLGRGAISPKYLVKLWMKSPTHRSVLLSKYPKKVGIGAYPNSSGEWVVAADFIKP